MTTLGADDLPSILAMLAIGAIILLLQRVQSWKARAAAAAVFFLIAEVVAWSLFPFTPLAYAGPPMLVLALYLIVELGAKGSQERRQPEQRNVRAVFQQRRTLCRRFSLLPMVASIAVFICAAVVRETFLIYVTGVPLATMPERKLIDAETGWVWVLIILVIPAVLLIGGMVFGVVVYRCPACEKIPVRSIGGDAAPDFNPTECPNCRARLV
jgi:hypothetical protein